MVNQQKIIPMGNLHGITIDIEGVRAVANFEVIEIANDSMLRNSLYSINNY